MPAPQGKEARPLSRSSADAKDGSPENTTSRAMQTVAVTVCNSVLECSPTAAVARPPWRAFPRPNVSRWAVTTIPALIIPAAIVKRRNLSFRIARTAAGKACLLASERDGGATCQSKLERRRPILKTVQPARTSTSSSANRGRCYIHIAFFFLNAKNACAHVLSDT